MTNNRMGTIVTLALCSATAVALVASANVGLSRHEVITPHTASHATHSLVPCATEDSDNCYWDARVQGNGVGSSFIVVDGHYHYGPDITAAQCGGYPLPAYTSTTVCVDGTGNLVPRN